MVPDDMSDPVIDEIHAARRAMSEKFGGDLNAMLEDARRRQEASGRAVWRPFIPPVPLPLGTIVIPPVTASE